MELLVDTRKIVSALHCFAGEEPKDFSAYFRRGSTARLALKGDCGSAQYPGTDDRDWMWDPR